MLDDDYYITVSVGKRDTESNLKFNWKDIDLNNEKNVINGPVVIVFGGNGTKNTKDANGNAKILQNFIGKINEPVEILSVAYGDYNRSNQYENNILLAEKLFFPLISDELGNRLSLDDALRNMRRVNVFSHCAGNSRFANVINELVKMMRNIDYSYEEIDKILGQIFLLGYAPLERDIYPSIKQFYVQSLDDDQLPTVNSRLWTIQKNAIKKNQKFQVSPKECTINEYEQYSEFTNRFLNFCKRSPFLISVLVGNQLHYFSSSQTLGGNGLDHTFTHVERNERYEIGIGSSFVAETTSVAISDVMLKYISNSIENEHSKKPKILGLMSETKEYCNSIFNQMNTLAYDEPIVF